MSASDVVEVLDVLGDGSDRLCTRSEHSVIDELGRDGRAETLGHCVVPAIALATHAGHDATRCERGSIVAAGIGATAIGIMHESLLGTVCTKSLCPSCESKLCIVFLARRPADTSVGLSHLRNDDSGTSRSIAIR